MQEKIQVAGCLLLDDYGRLLVLHRTHEDGLGAWYIPGGKREDDESLEDTAIREIKEELGVDVVLTQTLRHEAFVDNETEFSFHWFVAKIVRGQVQICEPDNFDDLDHVALEDMDSLALSLGSRIVVDVLMSGEVVLEQ